MRFVIHTESRTRCAIRGLYCIFLNDCLTGLQHVSHRIGHTCLSCLCEFLLYFALQTSHLAGGTNRQRKQVLAALCYAHRVLDS
jgi:hypothetical protein